MHRDIRETGIYREVEAYFRDIHAPGEGIITDAADVCVHPGGEIVALSGTIFSDLESSPVTRICLINLKTGEKTILDCPANNDRCPRWSPDGKWLAFLSDHQEAGNYQLCVANRTSPNKPKGTPLIEGFIEYLHWSPDGTKILVGVAGFGADLPFLHGGITADIKTHELPDWVPVVDTGVAPDHWRSVYVFDRKSGTTRRVSREGLNYWEANWCGNDALVAVVSQSPNEGSWYQACLVQHPLGDGPVATIYQPEDQIGLPVVSPSERQVAFVEAFCSDRLLVCGDLKVANIASRVVKKIDTDDVDVTHVQWRDDGRLLFTGHRDFSTVIAERGVRNSQLTVHWSGMERTLGAWYPAIWPSPKGGAMGIAESYETAPELVHFVDGGYRVVKSFGSRRSRAKGFNRATIEPVEWTGRDGLEIHGWLIRPEGKGPFPMVIDIHGGPVWQCRNRWAGRLRGAKVLADHGVASLYPNPRGSSGRGQAFAKRVRKDMGGEDAHDILRGCDAMVERGIADGNRLGVTGTSYGEHGSKQALEFHRSLAKRGVESVLVAYPTAAIDVHAFPEVIDATARYAGWFLEKFGLRENRP